MLINKINLICGEKIEIYNISKNEIINLEVNYLDYVGKKVKLGVK